MYTCRMNFNTYKVEVLTRNDPDEYQESLFFAGASCECRRHCRDACEN